MEDRMIQENLILCGTLLMAPVYSEILFNIPRDANHAAIPYYLEGVVGRVCIVDTRSVT